MEMITISNSEIERIKTEAHKNKNKRVDRKLQVLILRYEGKSNSEISEKTGYNERYVTTLIGQYQRQGLEEYIRIKQTSHRRNLSEAEEASVLEEYEQKANEGQELTKVLPLSSTILIWWGEEKDRMCYSERARREDRATLRSDPSARPSHRGRHRSVVLFRLQGRCRPLCGKR